MWVEKLLELIVIRAAITSTRRRNLVVLRFHVERWEISDRLTSEMV
jgi:hypothetical protein